MRSERAADTGVREEREELGIWKRDGGCDGMAGLKKLCNQADLSPVRRRVFGGGLGALTAEGLQVTRLLGSRGLPGWTGGVGAGRGRQR